MSSSNETNSNSSERNDDNSNLSIFSEPHVCALKKGRISSKNFIPKNLFFSQPQKENLNPQELQPQAVPPKKEEKKENPLVSYYTNSQKEPSENFPDSNLNWTTSEIINILENEKQFAKLSKADESESLQNSLVIQKYSQSQKAKINLLLSQLKTQKGCRVCQGKITKNPNFGNNVLYPLLKPYMLEIINDQFGNYLYQNYIDIFNKRNLKHFVKFISKNFKEIAYSPNGTKVIQKLLETFYFYKPEAPEIYTHLTNRVKGNVKEMCKEKHGNYVVQKLIPLGKNFDINFIYEEIYQDFLEIAMTKYGCCVIQKCLAFGNESQKQTIVNLVLQNMYYLISHKFGNYIVQSIITSCEDWVVSAIYGIISKDIIALSKEKYSSNVIEKFFEIPNKRLINEIGSCMLHYDWKIYELISNEYGNYIIQKILFSVTDEVIINKILFVILKNLTAIENMPYGRGFLKRLIVKYPSLSSSNLSSTKNKSVCFKSIII